VVFCLDPVTDAGQHMIKARTHTTLLQAVCAFGGFASKVAELAHANVLSDTSSWFRLVDHREGFHFP